MDFFTAPVDVAFFQTSLLEMIAVGSGILYVLLMQKENVMAYPFGIVNVLIYALICYMARWYAYAAINLFYFTMSIFGWYNWLRPRQGNGTFRISSCNLQQHAISIGSVILLTLILWYLLMRFTDSRMPLWDALTSSLFAVAMFLLAWKKTENWLYWIAGNIISVFMFAGEELWFSSMQFAIFTVLAVAGYFKWKRRLSALQ